MIAARQPRYSIKEEKAFLLALSYFDIFNYPLTLEEVVRFSPASINFEITSVIEKLVEQKMIFRFDQFYSQQNDPSLAQRRVSGNLLAKEKMTTAAKFTKIIAAFPFVRAVMLSGSISKGYMDEKSDIDYFIITTPGRLWIVRTMLALFRRLILFNSHKNLCTNYFIDSNHLEIQEKNIFSATELITLKKMHGKKWINEFCQANTWASSFFPNLVQEDFLGDDKEFFLKPLSEKILSLSIFDRLDKWLMGRSVNWWKKRYIHNMEQKDFNIAFQSTPYVSRSHPLFYQKKVLALYDSKIKDFETRHGLSLEI